VLFRSEGTTVTEMTAPPPPVGGLGTETGKDRMAAMAATATEAGGDVLNGAKEQAHEVAAETRRQLRDLYGQARTELNDQARTQLQRAARGLSAAADEAAQLADRADTSGPVTEVVREGSDRLRRVGQWLENREPQELVTEVRGYARRHPGLFLTGAAVLGVVAGRLMRNLGGTKDSAPAATGMPTMAMPSAVAPSTVTPSTVTPSTVTPTTVTPTAATPPPFSTSTVDSPAIGARP